MVFLIDFDPKNLARGQEPQFHQYETLPAYLTLVNFNQLGHFTKDFENQILNPSPDFLDQNPSREPIYSWFRPTKGGGTLRQRYTFYKLSLTEGAPYFKWSNHSEIWFS